MATEERSVKSILDSGLEFKEISTVRSSFKQACFGGSKGKMKGRCFKVRVYPSNKAQVSGNLHYYYTDGVHNANDFSCSDVLKCIDNICQTLNIKPEEAKINGFEFGVNVTPPFELDRLFQSLLVLGKEVVKKDEKLNSYTFNFSQYSLKIYDKGAMFPAFGKVLRVELHIAKMQAIKKSVPRLKTLRDLKDIRVLQMLRDDFLKKVESLLVSETMDWSKMSEKNKLKYGHFSSKGSWVGISAEERRVWKSLFMKLTENYSLSHTKKDLLKSLEQKLNQLFSIKTSFLPDVAFGESSNNAHEITDCQGLGIPMILPLEIKGKKVGDYECFGRGLTDCFVGHTGKFYISHPLQNELFAQYPSIGSYNLRLDMPSYIEREVISDEFIKPCKLDYGALIASIIQDGN